MLKKVTVVVECSVCKEAHETFEVDPLKAQTFALGTLVAAQLVKKGWKALSFVAACPKCKDNFHGWREASEKSVQAIKKLATKKHPVAEPVAEPITEHWTKQRFLNF
jgi:hypothetical protein